MNLQLLGARNARARMPSRTRGAPRIRAARAWTLALALPLFVAPASWRAATAQETANPTANPTPSQTASPTYNIELIIFRATSASGGAENWSAESGAGAAIIGEESATGSSQVGHFVGPLAASQHQLTELETRLRSSGAYVPVAHAGWSQTASAWGTRAGFPLQRLGVDVPGLSGNVFLERGQYLHLGMTLQFAMPTPPAGLGAAPGTTFTINESRRIRFYERNYYDHPAFGVIALVTPAQGARAPGR